ncbi:YchJ family protein [Marichromatium bheemlicum]|nr:YchJ family metal-binding protein [Marichromatium bheemlicum]
MSKQHRPETTDCPCGSARPLAACCGRYLSGRAHAATAAALMRSRYTAFVLGAEDYLRATWHPAHCPADLAPGDPPPRWLGLRILATTAGGPDDDQGMVEFVARYKVGGRAHRLHERSRFARLEGRWVYVDGTFPEAGGTN